MGLVSKLLLLPIKGPADGALWVASKVAEQAEKERNSPVAIKAALAQAEAQLLAGELSEDAYDDLETELLLRLKAASAS